MMSLEDIMRRVLPPIGGVSPHITGAPGRYGAGLKEGRVPPSTIPHRGVDFNYVGGRTARLNLSHPALRSPVDGIVINAGQGTAERIAIRDKDGFVHEILHSDKRHVAIGDPVVAGQLIGTMGNTGTHDQHVHYQLKDPAGKDIDPSAFWDQQGPVDPNPAPPAYLQEYQQYLQGTGGNEFDGAPTSPNNGPSPSRSASFSDRFGNWDSAPATTASPTASDRPESFDNRFGNWGPPAGRFGDTRSPVLRALEKYSGSVVPGGSGSTSASVQGASLGMPSSPPNSVGTGGVLGNYMDPSLIAGAGRLANGAIVKFERARSSDRRNGDRQQQAGAICQPSDRRPTASIDIERRRAVRSAVATTERTAGWNLQRPADVAISAAAVVLGPSGRYPGAQR